MRRRFFQSFQQRVERLLCQHVNLVNDIDLKFAARREADIVAKFANLIDAIVARAVDLEHIEIDSLRYFSAGITDSARMDGRTVDTVHGLGQNPGSRSFACAAGADKKVSVSQSLLLNRILQGANNVILAENIVENLGSIFSRKDLVTHVDNVVSRPRNSINVAQASGLYRELGSLIESRGQEPRIDGGKQAGCLRYLAAAQYCAGQLYKR